MIEQIYLDMDGVLCDFETAAVNLGLLDIKNRKVDWQGLKAEGTRFWEGLDWKPEGMKLYEFLEDFCKEHHIDLCILTSIMSMEGKEGKRNWIRKNTSIPAINVNVVSMATAKKRYAEKTSLLIDDYNKNVQEFIQAGGNAIKFRNDAEEAIEKIKEIITGAENGRN